jgi:hypothetical protein
MSILPKLRDNLVQIPVWEVPIIWSWRTVTMLIACGGVGMVTHMIGFENLSDASVIAIFAGAFIASLFVVYFAYYDGFKKQQQDSALLKVRKARGETLTVEEEVQISKAEKFDVRYIFGMFISIVMSGAIAVVVTALAGQVCAIPDAWTYFAVASFGVGFLTAAVLDQYCVHKAVDGRFRADVITPLAEKLEAEAIEASKAKDKPTDVNDVVTRMMEVLQGLRQ